MTPRVGSLFSGAGGMDIGFEAAGFEVAWQCDVDEDCVTVLERHWPDVPRYGDVRDVDPARLAPVDVVIGGFPCQDLSVAGKRAGLKGERSGLFWEVIRIVRGMREATNGRYPAVVVLENVPGLLSAGGGRDFSAVLWGLRQLGAAVAWRILDARFFGVPQRRRRVFIVADFAAPGAGERRAAEVLSLLPSGSRDSAACGEAGEGVAGDVEDGAGVVGEPLAYQCHGNNVGAIGTLRQGNGGLTGGVPFTAVAAFGGNRTAGPIDVATACNAHGGPHGRQDFESETFILSTSLRTANSVQASAGHHGHSSPRGDGSDNLVAVATWDERNVTSQANRARRELGSPANTLHAEGLSLVTPMAVRRLTPLECERLQGWGDNWTRYRANGDEISDGPRYRMVGNGVCVPVARWIGRRLRAALEQP